MAPRKRSLPQRVVGKEQWLQVGEPRRSRPWAYDELLFGNPDERERSRELGEVVGELEQERAELARLYHELDRHVARIASCERRLHELGSGTEHDGSLPVPSTTLPHTRAAAAGPGDLRAASDERSYQLTRCEGFEVDSPGGFVGFVEGLRFISRIDHPDLLEVRGGRFGRQLLLIPSEQVEEVRVTEERVFVRYAPAPTGDLLAAVVDRVRRALHVDQAAS
jgi:hypothetical protein